MYLTSLVILLLPVELCSEWVEISQLTYRKPFTTFNQLDRRTTPIVRASIHEPKSSDKRITALEIKKHLLKDDSEIDKKVIDVNDKASKIEDIGNKETIIKLNVTSNKNGSVSNNDKYDNIVKLLTLVADTISKQTTKNINTKLGYLHQLQRSLLNDIEQRIEATWPDESDDGSTDNPGSRKKRAAAAASTTRGHVDFPSSESALMTISFLTFAVFLIKLVLQVIQTYKNKTMMMTPAVLAFSKTVEVGPDPSI